MNIIDKTKKTTTTFGDLMDGDVFLYDKYPEDILFKVGSDCEFGLFDSSLESEEEWAAVSLKSGDIIAVPNERVVTKLKATITIEGEIKCK